MSVAQLARQRWRLAVRLSLVVFVVYFGFVLLIAFDKSLMGTLLAPGLSVGILLGALVIVVTWIVTWYYVRWANRHFDPQVRALRNNSHGGDR